MDQCDSPTDVNHALNCRKGGLVIRRHNKVRDIGGLMAMGFGNVAKEPIVREGDFGFGWRGTWSGCRLSCKGAVAVKDKIMHPMFVYVVMHYKHRWRSPRLFISP